MAMTVAERKRRERERNEALGMSEFRMSITSVEREAIAEAAELRGYSDQTEYIVRLVLADRDTSRKENVCSYPDCQCPFDMGPDGKCLVGKPRGNEV